MHSAWVCDLYTVYKYNNLSSCSSVGGGFGLSNWLGFLSSSNGNFSDNSWGLGSYDSFNGSSSGYWSFSGSGNWVAWLGISRRRVTRVISGCGIRRVSRFVLGSYK